MIVMSPTEKEVLREAAILLATGTSNSMHPKARAEWTDCRDRIVDKLMELTE